MSSVPDRTKANMALLAETAANGSPSFPFHVCHRNGYFDPALPATLIQGEKTEIVFTAPVAWTDQDGENGGNHAGYETYLGHFNETDIFLTPVGLRSDSIGDNDQDFKYIAGRTYKMVVSLVVTDGITVKLYDMAGGAPLFSSSVASANQSASFILGYPTRAIMAQGYLPAENTVIHSVSRPVDPATMLTTINMFPNLKYENGMCVGKLFTTHPTQTRGFKYTISNSGWGGFPYSSGASIRGEYLYLASGEGAETGGDVIVSVEDNFGNVGNGGTIVVPAA